MEIGIELPNCHFALPGESRELFFSATVRNYFQYTSRSGAVFWRIGLQFGLAAGRRKPHPALHHPDRARPARTGLMVITASLR
jgi:hypothetical protein